MPNESPWLSTDTIAFDNAAGTVKRGLRNLLTTFMEFVLRDSVLEVSLGLMYALFMIFRIFLWLLDLFSRIATSFTAVVNSLISDVVLPPLSLIPNPFSSGSAGGLEEKFLILRPGHSSIIYNTRAQAIEDGALILSYGYALTLLNTHPSLWPNRFWRAFADKLVNIIGLSLILFLFKASGVHQYLSPPKSANDAEYSIKCPFCRKEVSSKASWSKLELFKLYISNLLRIRL